uniref:Mitochondrial ribosomal protein S24 n=2 Tax=Eptatretus burgeri TaxID=7764 RepID=A0A8C4R386_EPTBU
MAGSLVKTQAWKSSLWHLRSMHTSAACSKHFAARVRVSKGTKAVTYEEFNPPHQIAHRKGWLSQHTSNLDGEEGAAKRTLEDVFIRRFMYGTFHGCLATPPVIKRRANILIICAIIIRRIPPFKYHFLATYTETLLSYLYKCPVKLELQTVEHKPVYKYI